MKPAILLGAHAGLRLAETAALRVADVDFETGVVGPLVQWGDKPPKSELSRRPIPIPLDMARLLASAVPLGDGSHLVSDQWGNPGGPWTIQRAVRAAIPVIGLPEGFRLHGLRHYFASLLIAGARREGRAGAPSSCVGQDDPRHLRAPLAGQGRHLAGCRRGRLQGKGRTMGFYEPGICVDTFEPDPDGLIRVRRYDIGEIITITDDELMGFARVVRYEGDVFTGYICLQELHGEEAEQAAKDLELSYEDWCDPLDD